MHKLAATKHSIGQRVRELRQERHWTQERFADLLGISQNYLSELERGHGSFTAEQLLTILKHFNVPVDYFAPQKAAVGDQIQNALAWQGATHLAESSDVIPSEQLKRASDAIREALVSAESSRQITAIAPILVKHAGHLNLTKLRGEFAKLGLENRFGWAIDNTLEAIREESAQLLPRDWRVQYRRAAAIIGNFFEHWQIFRETPDPRASISEDVLDPGIASKATLNQVKQDRSPIAQRWHVVTRIERDDFVEALRAARGTS